MTLKQLTVFLENKPNQLALVCQALANAGLDIATLSLADTETFGILRLLVNDWQKAQQALAAIGFTAKVTDVAAVKVENRAGGLASLLETVTAANLDVKYVYALSAGNSSEAVMVFRFSEPQQALHKLSAAGIELVTAEEIFGRGGKRRPDEMERLATAEMW